MTDFIAADEPKRYKTLSLPFIRPTEIQKTDWLRLPERETTTHKVKTPKEMKRLHNDWNGPRVQWSRSVAHVGYWLTPTDMPADLLEAKTIWHARNNVNRVLAEGIYGLEHEGRIHPLRDSGDLVAEEKITFAQLQMIMGALGIKMPAAMKNLRYQIRFQWWKSEMSKTPKEHLNIRTIWYFDHPPVEGWIDMSEKLAVAVVGRRDEGWDDTYSYGGGDAQPPSFEQWSRQSLYHCRVRETKPTGIRNDQYEYIEPPAILGKQLVWRVHPLDVTFLK